MTTGGSTTTAWMAHVARRMGTLLDRAVFLGGAVVELLITDRAAFVPRPTQDVDVAVVEVESYADQAQLAEHLRQLGFTEDHHEGAPACRWVVDGIRVDVMPTASGPWGATNRFHGIAYAQAASVALAPDILARVISAPCFIAAKLVAFLDRGRGDCLSSHDLEDIVAVIDGRPEVVDEVAAAPVEVRAFVSETVGRLLGEAAFLDALGAHLPPDAASQARAELVETRLRRMAATD